MLTLALSLLLGGGPSPVDAWALQSCPSPAQPPDSSIEYRALEASRTACLRRAMDGALERVLAPLRQQPSAWLQWVGLQADYNRWMADACASVEEARWVDVATGRRAMGADYGLAESHCLRRQYALRGLFLEALARGEVSTLDAALSALSTRAPARRDALEAWWHRALEASARAPAPVGDSTPADGPLSQEDWGRVLDRLERAAVGPEALARRQCALVPQLGPTCVGRLEEGLMALLELPSLPTAPSAQAPGVLR